MEISRYPDLSLVKEEPPSPCLSPVLPMLPAPDGKGKRIYLFYLVIYFMQYIHKAPLKSKFVVFTLVYPRGSI